jgi:hypothetical protein
MRAPLLGLFFAALALLLACKPSPSSGSAAPPPASVTATASAAPLPSATAKSPTTKLTGQQLKDAYASTMGENDPFAKELAGVTRKLGDPEKVDGDSRYWWGWSPAEGALEATCWELSMSPTQGSSIGGTDWAKCGMAE